MPSDFTEAFGPTVKRARLARGLSQSEVSRAAGLKHGHLSAIERGRRVPRSGPSSAYYPGSAHVDIVGLEALAEHGIRTV